MEDLRCLLFRKQKFSVPQDVWFPEGGDQFVEAVVSREHVLRSLMAVLLSRERWLAQQKLSMDFLMRDGVDFERDRFLKHMKNDYHSETHQLVLQQNDIQFATDRIKEAKAAGRTPPKLQDIIKGRKHSRWNLELRRRLGCKALWEVVSFTGRYSLEFLTSVRTQAPSKKLDESEQTKQTELKAKAMKCRDTLRYAVHLAKMRQPNLSTSCQKQFSARQTGILAAFDSGALLDQVNEATFAHGFGRVTYPDGSYIDLGNVGATRRALDECTEPEIVA